MNRHLIAYIRSGKTTAFGAVALAIGVEQALSDSPNWGMVAVMLIVAGIGFLSRDADVSSQQSGIRVEPPKEPTP